MPSSVAVPHFLKNGVAADNTEAAAAAGNSSMDDTHSSHDPLEGNAKSRRTRNAVYNTRQVALSFVLAACAVGAYVATFSGPHTKEDLHDDAELTPSRTLAAARRWIDQQGVHSSSAAATPRWTGFGGSTDPWECKTADKCPRVAPGKEYLDLYGDETFGASVKLSNLPSTTVSFPSELNVKVYVYETDDIPALRSLTQGNKMSLSLCSKGMWGTQVALHQYLAHNTRIRTRNPDEADYFFVPAYPKCALDKQGMSEMELGKLYIAAVTATPYFRRNGGRDHMFVFPSGRGVTCFREWRRYIPQSIILGPEGHFTDNYAAVGTPYFHVHKDIVIPGRVDHRRHTLLEKAKPLGKPRRYLAAFYGNHQGKKPRLDVLALAKKYPNEVMADCKRNPRYAEIVGDSKFCFAPRGQSSWTLRFYESFFSGCIPVILADDIELPFSEFVDYSKFTVKWPLDRVNDDLVRYLRSVPDDVIARMQDMGRRVLCLFVYHHDERYCNSFSALLHVLQKRRWQFKLSRESFWMPDGAIVDRSMVPVSNWRPPFKVSGLYGNDVGDNKCPSCKWGGPNVCVTTADGMKCKGLTKEQDPGNGKCPP
ncbi:hypothetical protein PPROV_000619000 [Pycnococcus provasolii]|uniref:Exostosin GT47 domain-containing protein n=1 Tax=Pycnococcus provasolii TaxID=41880 RepID=A0A830HKP1_9CHLO|nr:hypothetical protein PPROV_000619000 [Pycnococcus provasolii]